MYITKPGTRYAYRPNIELVSAVRVTILTVPGSPSPHGLNKAAPFEARALDACLTSTSDQGAVVAVYF